jgi:hypothetical protein
MAAHFDTNVPMHVKVALNGTVTFTVDLQQVDIEDDDNAIQRHTVAERDRLQLLISAACSRLGDHITVTNPPTTPQEAP